MAKSNDNRLTLRQGRRIYRFIKDNANNAKEMIDHYVSLEKQKALDKKQGIELIGNIHKWEKGLIAASELEENFHKIGMPETFKLVSDKPTEEKKSPFAEFAEFAAEEEEEEDNEKNSMDELIERLELVLNPDTIKQLKNEIKRIHELHDETFEEAKRRFEEKIEELEKRKPAIPELEPMDSEYIKHKDFDKVAAYINKGINTLLIGPAGTGKSMMGREIAKSLNLEYFEQSLGGGMRYAQIIGTKDIENGKSFFTPSKLLEAMQDENKLIILNEIFGLEPEVLLAFNDAFEKKTRFVMTPDGRVEIKAKVLATANTTGRNVSRQYTGAQRVDDSLLSRFGAKIKIEIDPKVEEKLLEQIPNEEHRLQMAAKVRELRENIKSNNIAFDAGTRELVNYIDNYSAVGDVDIAFEDSFLGGLSRSEKSKLGY
jgi:MoxR-like ATPase